jgi:hypothetical protein
MRGQRGQTAAEYLGGLLVVGVIIAALATTNLGAQIAQSMHSLVCTIAAQDCGDPPANAAEVDSDHDGVLDGDDPVPNADDIDGDGLSDGEEIALGSDPTKFDTDGDGTPDGWEVQDGTDPTQGILPLTEENVLTPWVRVGLTAEQWAELEKEILDEVNPHGWKGFLLGGPTATAVTLDEDGELKLIYLQENGVNPAAVLRALGVGGKALSATGAAAKAALRVSGVTRAALIARGIIPGVARARPPIPPTKPGVVLNAVDDLGRPTGAAATITEEMLGTGTAAARGIRPPGFLGGAANHARGHLIARSLGGSGTDSRNLVTLFNRGANSPVMRDFEAQVASAVRSGQTVKYEVTPIYRGTELVPRAVTLRAAGSGGFRLDVTVLNKPLP